MITKDTSITLSLAGLLASPSISDIILAAIQDAKSNGGEIKHIDINVDIAKIYGAQIWVEGNYVRMGKE